MFLSHAHEYFLAKKFFFYIGYVIILGDDIYFALSFKESRESLGFSWYIFIFNNSVPPPSIDYLVTKLNIFILFFTTVVYFYPIFIKWKRIKKKKQTVSNTKRKQSQNVLKQRRKPNYWTLLNRYKVGRKGQRRRCFFSCLRDWIT